MPVEQFYRLLRKLGYKIDHQPFDQWCSRLESCSSEENVLRVLSCLFTGKQPEGENLVARFGVRQALMDTSNTKKLLSESGMDCPDVYKRQAGKNAKKIAEYIQNQLKEDQIEDQMTIKEYIDPFTGSKE